jgi:hypothetical protein
VHGPGAVLDDQRYVVVFGAGQYSGSFSQVPASPAHVEP